MGKIGQLSYDKALSIRRQCALLAVARSGFYLSKDASQ